MELFTEVTTNTIFDCEDDLGFNPWDCTISSYNACYPEEFNSIEIDEILECYLNDDNVDNKENDATEPTTVLEYSSDVDEEVADVEYTPMRCIMKVDEQNVTVLIDTGADVSLITTPLLNQLGYDVNGDSDITIVALGEYIEPLGIIANLPLLVQNELVPTTLHVLNTRKKYLLLGSDWLRKQKATLDYSKEELILICNDKEQHLPVFFNREQRKDLNLHPNNFIESEYESEFTAIPSTWGYCEICSRKRRLNNIQEPQHICDNKHCSLLGEKCDKHYRNHIHAICNKCWHQQDKQRRKGLKNFQDITKPNNAKTYGYSMSKSKSRSGNQCYKDFSDYIHAFCNKHSYQKNAWKKKTPTSFKETTKQNNAEAHKYIRKNNV